MLTGPERRVLHKDLSDSFSAMIAAWRLCGDDRFDGKRREYDFVASEQAKEIVDDVMKEAEGRGHTDDYTASDFAEMTDSFDDAIVKLWEICVPPGWEP